MEGGSVHLPNGQIRKLPTSVRIIAPDTIPLLIDYRSVHPGTGKAGKTPDGAPVTGTPLNGPRSLDFDREGTLWLITREGNQLLRLDLAGGVIHHVAGTGKKGFTGNGGPADVATLSGPKGIALAPNGDVYLADTENHVIRRVSVRHGNIDAVAGTGTAGVALAANPLQTELRRPHGIFVDADGTIFISDSENHRILSIPVGVSAR